MFMIKKGRRRISKTNSAEREDSHDRSRDQERQDFYARRRREDGVIPTGERESRQSRTYGRRVGGRENDPIRIEEEKEEILKEKIPFMKNEEALLPIPSIPEPLLPVPIPEPLFRSDQFINPPVQTETIHFRSDQFINPPVRTETSDQFINPPAQTETIQKDETRLLSSIPQARDFSSEQPVFLGAEVSSVTISLKEQQQEQQQNQRQKQQQPFTAGVDWTDLEAKRVQEQITTHKAVVLKTDEQTQTDFLRKELVPARKKYNLRLFDCQDIQKAWETVKGLDPNSLFLSIASALLDLIEKVYENGEVLIRETLTANGASADTFAYLEYLERNKNNKGSETWEVFHVAAIENAQLTFMRKREVGFLNLLRLCICKREVIEAIRQILLLPCTRKMYSNNIRLFPSCVKPHEVRFVVGKYKPVAGQPDFDREVAIKLFSQLRMAKEDTERFFINGESWYRNQFDPTRDLLFHLRLVEGFMDPAFPEDRSFFHHYALKGAFFLGEGEVDIRSVKKSEDDGKVGLVLQSENGTSTKGLRACSLPLQKGNVTLTESVTVQFFLNNASRTSRRGDINPPADAGNLLLALSHQVVSRTAATDTFEMEEEEEEEEEFFTKAEEEEEESSSSSSFLPSSLNGEKALPTFFKIDRNSQETSFKNVYSLLNRVLLNNTSMARDYLEAIMKFRTSLDIEANVFIEGLTPHDDVSIYLEWKAIEAPPEHMMCLGLTNVLASQVKSQIKKETIGLQAMIRTSPYSASLTKALAVLLDKRKK